MAKLPFLALRGANLYVEGDSAQNVFETIKLPFSRESYESFTPAAGNGAIEIATTREACEIGGTAKGLSPVLMRLAQLPFGQRAKFTVYGALVNEYATTAAGREVQLIATAYARVSYDIGDASGGSLTGVEYMFKSISKYNLVIGGEEIARFNVELGGWQSIDGQSALINQMLGLIG